jgi:hypothetical protein
MVKLKQGKIVERDSPVRQQLGILNPDHYIIIIIIIIEWILQILYKFIIKPIINVPGDCLHLIRRDILLDKLRNRKTETNKVIELREILKTSRDANLR